MAGGVKRLSSRLSGSYVKHYISSMVMTFLFLLTVSWLSYSQSDYSFRQENYRLEIAFILTALISLGWLMSMIMGIIIDLFPITHDLDAYTETHSNQYLAINIIGQLVIMVGIFSNDLELMLDMATVGLVLLSWGTITLAMPSWNLHKNSVENDINCGNVALIPAMLIPFSSLVILSCWIFRQKTGMLIFGFSVSVVVLMGTVALTLILAHFNRRLSWELVKFRDFRPIVSVYLILALLHCFAAFLFERGDVSENISKISQSLPFFWAFFSTRPFKMLKMAIGSNSKPHSRIIASSQYYFLVVGVMSLIPDFNPGKFTNITYVTLIFSTVMLAVWGSGIYLHQDHLHKSIHSRDSMYWLIVYNAIGVTSLFLIGFEVTIINEDSDLVYFFMRNFALSAMIIYIIILLFKDLFVSLETWHRVPMHHERYVQ